MGRIDNWECGLRLRLHPRGASAPEGEPSGSERLRIAELGILERKNIRIRENG